ncbi:MAG: methyltransferase domain-containing protein [Gammaproteobacteria bacterium]
MRAVSLAHRIFACSLLCVSLCAQAAGEPDLYDKATANTARSDSDRKRDALDHPTELLRLAGIKPGMNVADIMAGGGYYSELLSYVIGTKGHVLMLNNAAFDGWSPSWQKRVAGNRLPNVEHRTVDLNHMNLAPASLDAVLMIKIYHDLYWIDPKGEWPKVDVPAVLDQLARALKPGGVLLVVDHSARAGTGKADASSLHRIDETFARKDFESHGFELTGHSEVLRRPDDKRDLLSYDGPGLNHTDRFVLVFRKR